MNNDTVAARECSVEGCPYRYFDLGTTGKMGGYCSMVRAMLTFGCPVCSDRRSGN